MQVIDRNARALSRMIDELLDLSTVTNRKLRLIRERTEMNEWTRATLETIRPDWEKKELDASTFIPNDKPVELEIDPTRLAQVLTNLMTNAIKYTDREGQDHRAADLARRRRAHRRDRHRRGAEPERDRPDLRDVPPVAHAAHAERRRARRGPDRGALAGGAAWRRTARGERRRRQGRDIHALAAADEATRERSISPCRA